MNDTQLDAEITGVLKTIAVKVGDRLHKGETVAQLDCEQHEIAVNSAAGALEAGKSRHDLSELQLANARKLSEKRSISQEELDKRISDARTSQAELDQLTAAYDSAQLTVQKCDIRAPFNAVVIERIASIGDYAVPGTPILRLLDDENIEISAKIQEQDLDGLSQADQLTFNIRGKSQPARLRKVLPLMDSRLKTYEVRLDFIDETSHPGTTGRLSWKAREGHIPSDLIVRRSKEFGVFVVETGKANFVPLKGARPGHPAPYGMSGQTRIIVDGRFVVRSGDAVEVR